MKTNDYNKSAKFGERFARKKQKNTTEARRHGEDESEKAKALKQTG